VATADSRTVTDEREQGPPPRGVRLTVTAGPERGTQVSVVQRSAIIGRADTADLKLTDRRASSFHAEVSATEGGIAVTDLESTNGTFYAGARLRSAIVPAGASIGVGESVVKLELDAEIATESSPSFGELRGQSASMRALFALSAKLARTSLSVLIEGPTGTGKELLARALHDESARKGKPFVVVDCTAIPPSLAESVLFGHEKGAFTGATARREGLFEAARGGTVFLDEVGELPTELQPKLLRVLERRQIVRVGGTEPSAIDVRVLAATWRDLRAMVNQGTFREDLYYRLAQARVAIPPLRERSDDVPALVYHFLQRIGDDVPAARSISRDALADLRRRDWPGNVRELRAAVERAAMMAEGSQITPADLAFERVLIGAPARDREPDPDAPVEPYKEAKRTLLDEWEREYLVRLLAKSGDNVTRAAALAQVERHYLRQLFRRHGLRGEE
jgi:DNA-binding NtrC family response regulator